MFSKAERNRERQKERIRASERKRKEERGIETEKYGSRKAEGSCRALRTCQNLRGIRTLDTMPLLESGVARFDKYGTIVAFWRADRQASGERGSMADYPIVNNAFDVR